MRKPIWVRFSGRYEGASLAEIAEKVRRAVLLFERVEHRLEGVRIDPGFTAMSLKPK